MRSDQLRAVLGLRDLTDPAHGPHCMQLVLDAIVGALAAAHPKPTLIVRRAQPIVSARGNYHRL